MINIFGGIKLRNAGTKHKALSANQNYSVGQQEVLGDLAIGNVESLQKRDQEVQLSAEKNKTQLCTH